VILWFGKGPLCALAGVDRVDPGSEACTAAASLPFSLTAQVVGLIVVLVVGAGLLVWQLVRLDRSVRGGRGPAGGGVGVAPDRRDRRPGAREPRRGRDPAAATPLVQTPSIPGELSRSSSVDPGADRLAGLVGSFAAPVRRGHGARVHRGLRRVLPEWSGLPLPNGIFNWYQGLLPTWLYPFQFAVNTDPPFTVSFASPWPLLLLAAVLVSAAIVAYSAWVWRLAIAERLADEAAPSTSRHHPSQPSHASHPEG